MRILIVEDSRTVARIVAGIFSEAEPGAEVLVAGDGDEALVLLQDAAAGGLDLVLLDLKLSGASGLDVLAAVRADPALERTAVIVFSGSTDPDDLVRCYQLRVNCFLSKPSHPEQLARAARSIHGFFMRTTKRSAGTASRNQVETLLPPESPSVAAARALVTDTFHGWGLAEDVVEDAALCTSELVTNAIVHVRSNVGLSVLRLVHTARVEVHDDDPDASLVRVGELSGDDDTGRGRGLALVDALSLTWGVDVHDAGKTVWFELPLD